MKYASIQFEISDKIAVLTLNRPEVKNALDNDIRVEIADVIRRLREGVDTKNLDVRALIFKGAGDAFSAGGDVKGMTISRTTAMIRNRIVEAHTWFSDLVNLEIPVIAVVNGPAFGAGFSLSLAADFILATPNARFCSVFARMGLIPDLAALYLLPRIVGLQRAKEIVFSSCILKPDEAKSYGIVYDIVEEDEIDGAAMTLAQKFQGASMTAIGLSKVLLNRSFHTDQAAMAELEAFAQGACVGTDDHKSSVSSFLKKQPFSFSGFGRSNWRKKT
ncbi:enoyl-CoA hydratase/isomerase family protein [uncultured Sneathiella sp.]|uniref:enoyl-CoA hydratase/isomerase family protein n=1 Tax=uncultured Sneathiella sp. TaxID=879315 RepID=UPI0025914C52|nr:enoyl-CoA hydratase/isomerase family protein [uncultured Sneathiella sp.]